MRSDEVTDTTDGRLQLGGRPPASGLLPRLRLASVANLFTQRRNYEAIPTGPAESDHSGDEVEEQEEGEGRMPELLPDVMVCSWAASVLMDRKKSNYRRRHPAGSSTSHLVGNKDVEPLVRDLEHLSFAEQQRGAESREEEEEEETDSPNKKLRTEDSLLRSVKEPEEERVAVARSGHRRGDDRKPARGAERRRRAAALSKSCTQLAQVGGGGGGGVKRAGNGASSQLNLTIGQLTQVSAAADIRHKGGKLELEDTGEGVVEGLRKMIQPFFVSH